MGVNFEERVQEQYTKALKARDATVVATLRLLLNSLKNEKIAKRGDLDDEGMLAVVRREAKKRREAIEAFAKAGHADRAAQEQAELTILEEFLPAQMTEEQVGEIVARVIATAQPSGPADFGKVMGAAMKELKGKADGALVQKTVKQQLAGMTS